MRTRIEDVSCLFQDNTFETFDFFLNNFEINYSTIPPVYNFVTMKSLSSLAKPIVYACECINLVDILCHHGAFCIGSLVRLYAALLRWMDEFLTIR